VARVNVEAKSADIGNACGNRDQHRGQVLRGLSKRRIKHKECNDDEIDRGKRKTEPRKRTFVRPFCGSARRKLAPQAGFGAVNAPAGAFAIGLKAHRPEIGSARRKVNEAAASRSQNGGHRCFT
jgi:hypothetical protein